MGHIKLLILYTLLHFGLTQVRCQDEFTKNMEYQRIKELRPLAVEFVEHFKNITQTDLKLANNRLPSQQDLQCLADMAQLMNGLSSGHLWALKMIDSWGTLPSGLLYGNVNGLGNYDECLDINELISNTKIKGKYCFARFKILVDTRIAVCFPSSCSAAHMDTLLQQLLNKLLGVNITKQIVSEDSCKTSEKEPLDGLAIFTIVLLSVLGASMILATICDYLFYDKQSQLPVLVRAFSARANSRILFRLVEPKTNPNVIDCLNGMRCMSLIWVIFGHQYIFAVMRPNINPVALYYWSQNPFTMFIFHAVFSVDTFFFLSGLLLVMIALRSMEKTKGKLNIAMMYLHRYLRLAPILAVAILVYMKLIPQISNGPVTEKVFFDNYDYCKENWFWTLLFLQNYATPKMCMHHTWYLAVDMQLYILSPIFLITLYKWGKKAFAGIFVLMLLLSACLFSSMMTNKYRVNIIHDDMSLEAQRKFYFATHTHAAPWLIGLLFGYFLHVIRNKSFKPSRVLIWMGWLVSLTVMFTALFALYPATQAKAPELTMLEQASYYTLTRIAWPLCLCWVVFACVKDSGGLANSFLSSPLWQPLSKLSYSAYVFHVFVQTINARRVRSNTFFSDYDVMLLFWQGFGFILLLSYVMYIIIEAPFGVLEGMLMPQRRPKPKADVTNQTQVDLITQKLEDEPNPGTSSGQP